MNALERTVRRYGEGRFGALARQVRYQLQRIAASGIYACDHRSLWDEFRYEVREGPTPPLEEAWDETLRPFLHAAIGQLSDAEKRLLFFATDSAIEFDERKEALAPIDEQALMETLLGHLNALAASTPFKDSIALTDGV
jgi:hypothetical protein